MKVLNELNDHLRFEQAVNKVDRALKELNDSLAGGAQISRDDMNRLRDAAYVIAIERVAQASRDRGWV